MVYLLKARWSSTGTLLALFLDSLDSCSYFLSHRYPGTPADLNPSSLACSQLQNYDPDRALTDYITRLEALQRRLGTVQSGTLSLTKYWQHHGAR